MIPKISIIVPIFNVERFLKHCIESIRNQTLHDIEIILVNDGSPDNCLNICMEYQIRDKRIRVIDKPNGGVSSARNAGIQVAKGEYIGFVDPDDWIELDMYENMYYQVKDLAADICMCNYVVEKNNKSIPKLLDIKMDLLQDQEITNFVIRNMIGSPSLNSKSEAIMGSVCRLIVKKELINRHNLEFDTEVSFMEDLLFCVGILLKSKRVSINEGLYYHYVTNPQSAVTSYKNNMINMQKRVYKYLENSLKSEGVYPEVEKRMKIRYVKIFINAIANEVHWENPKTVKEKLKLITFLCKDDNLKRILKVINTKGYTLRRKFVLLAMKYEFKIYLYIYYSILIRKVKKRI